MANISGPFLCVTSWSGIGGNIEEGETYDEKDLGPGVLEDTLRAGYLVPVNPPPKPSPKRRASTSNNSSGGSGRKRRGSRKPRKD